MFQYSKIDGISPSYYGDVLVKSKDGKVGFLKPKKKSIQHKCGKKELTATVQLSRQITTLWNRYAYFIVGAVSDGMGGEYEEETVFDPLDAAKRFKEELEEKPASGDEKQYELFGSVPRGTKQLSDSQVKHRVLLFVKLCNACAADEVLKYIIEKAPKKANGTFAKNRITRIATLCCLSYSSEVFELVGMAKSDTEIEIKIREIGFNHKSMGLIENDLISETDMFKNLHNADDDEEDDEIESMKAAFRMGDISIQVPVFPLENGELAIDAKPYKPISSYRCVAKIENEFVITLPEAETFVIEHSGTRFEVVCGEYIPKIANCWEFIFAAAQYIHSPVKTGVAYKNIEKAEKKLRYVAFSKEEKKLLYRSEQFISEAVYLMLNCLEYLLDQHKIEITQLVCDAIDSGSSVKEWLKANNYYACHNLRKVGAFYLYFTPYIRRGNESRIEVIAQASLHKDWTIN